MSVNLGDVLGAVAVGLGAVAACAIAANNPEGFMDAIEKVEAERRHKAASLTSQELVAVIERVSTFDRIHTLRKYKPLMAEKEFQAAVTALIANNRLSTWDIAKAIKLL